MKPDNELDRLVAIKILGLPDIPWDENALCPDCGSLGRFCGDRSWCSNGDGWYYSPYRFYSSEIQYAWEIVEYFDKNGGAISYSSMKSGTRGHFVILSYRKSTATSKLDWVSSEGDSFPHAICLAALKTLNEP